MIRQPLRLVQGVGWSLAGLVLVGSTILGCGAMQRTVDVADVNPEYRIVVHQRGATAAEHLVVAGSVDEQVVTRWLQAHRTGWRLDFTSYAPSRQIKGGRFDLNFVGHTCVMNYDRTGQGDWVQVSRKIEESEGLPELFDRDR